ncbi:protein translocase subunit yajC [Breoghania corrubedonensis]|uniref:Sec translocon accessory complex subunit YajC n=1 Tax=Breoghania corrubedonensis TaxID=665038 RepID=A0A2T5V8H9_9HYPH|nr:preprotein translocase subunit YajC [Breoghania corrubedonensis]PTW60050.1 protein translocase subunit yajC [Breoghania corrubedonensis]
MFVTPAYAQTGAAAGGSELLLNILPFILIFAIMYFLIIRPQRQRMKQHQEMVSSLRRGDTVVTTGGIVGKVVKVLDETEAQIEIAEGVKVKVVRSMIQDVRSKGEPVKENG